MTVAETLLVFAGVPLLIIAVLAVLTLRPDKGHKRLRYKPGQPWEHAPVWYEPHPEHGPASGHAALTAGDGHGAAPARAAGPLGGARGTW